jgi:hypothetical protein
MEKKILSAKRFLMIWLIWILVLVTLIVVKGLEGSQFYFHVSIMFLASYAVAYYLEESPF